MKVNKSVIQAIINKIEEYDTIALFRHVYPDQDSYGSQVALKNMIEKSFPGKAVYLMGKHDEDLSYIGKMDEHQEEIVLDEKCLAIILDVGDSYRVDNQDYKKCGYVIKIDHHRPFEERFEDLSWVDIEYPATSLMLVDLLIESEGRLQMDKVGREALYIGIIADTGRFAFVSNPTQIFEKIVHITYDLDTKPLYAAYHKRKLNEVQFTGYIYNNFEIRKNGVAILKIPREVLEKYNMNYMVAARMVNTLQDIDGIVNWHFFAETPSGQIMSEFRSNGPCVNEIAAQYGGGGHFLAGGATLDSWDTVEAIIADFEENCGKFKAENK